MSKRYSGLSNGLSMEIASMGWIAAGMARLAAPFKSPATEATEDAEEFFSRTALAIGLFFSFFFIRWSSLFPAAGFFFLSSFASVSASHAALTLPREALRSLSHSAEP